MTIYHFKRAVKVRDTETGETRESTKRCAIDHQGKVVVKAHIDQWPKPSPRFMEIPDNA